MIKNVLVLGAGSAGLIAAISLKRKIPHLTVRVVRSPDIGVIGVGEGTTPNFPTHLFDFLGISRRRFYELAQPTWKIGIHFITLKGMVGPHENNKAYVNEMATFAWLDDPTLANVLTYARNDWGNQARPVDARDVRDVRKEVEKRDHPYTLAEITDLVAKLSPPPKPAEAKPKPSAAEQPKDPIKPTAPAK